MMPSSRLRRILTATVAGLLACAGVAAGSATASAATPNADSFLYANYPVNGSTTIHSNNSTLTLGPGSLSAALDVTTSSFTANLTLPPANASFTEFGIVPVTATAEFIQDGPITGQVVSGGIQSTANITIKLTNMKVAGIPVLLGDRCESQSPATLNLSSGAGFNVLTGGPLSATYTIPNFANCLLTTGVLNLLIPGDGNTIALTLDKPTVSLTPPTS
jgi:hypothetical protein